MAQTLLEVDHIKKSFHGIVALSDVTFNVGEGECVALVGENGAGKSTLMKILSGVWPHGSFDGELRYFGKPMKFESTLDARRTGISIIHQELCLFPELTVAENLFLTDAFPYDGKPSLKLSSVIHWKTLESKAAELLKDLQFHVPATAQVSELSVAQRQLVEIARAFHHQARLLILDEPTSALSSAEVQQLFDVVNRMRKERNMSFIYISHKLDEVFTLADRIVVLRDGRAVKELDPKQTDANEVIRYMVGRPVKESGRQSAARTEAPLFSVKDLSHISGAGKPLLQGVSFEVRPGEVFGIAGLMGSGRSEVLRSLLGCLPGVRQGSVKLDGKHVQWTDISEAMQDGVAFVPEDRKKDGLFLDQAIDFNLTLSSLSKFASRGVLDLKKEQVQAATLGKRLGIKFSTLSAPVKSLSGGNQQKVLLGKMIALGPRLLFLDEPTRGIDVGAKEEIYQIIRQLAQDGVAVVLVSSELPEVLALCDRVLVLREGTAVGELVNDGLTQERIMAFAAGGN